jgi:hypothetical protein
VADRREEAHADGLSNLFLRKAKPTDGRSAAPQKVAGENFAPADCGGRSRDPESERESLVLRKTDANDHDFNSKRALSNT